MGYLAVIHIQKLIHNTAIYSLDITGPLMVMVQRITGLAFSLYDGLGCDMDCLSTYRKKYLTKKQPSFIEFHGYLFQFQSILTGPNILFQDYMHFIDGTNFRHPKIKVSLTDFCIYFGKMNPGWSESGLNGSTRVNRFELDL